MNLPFFSRFLKTKHTSSTFQQESTSTNAKSDDYHKSIGKMSAFFAHEIRNPLTTINGFIQMMEREPVIQTDDKLSTYISIMKDESKRIELLIEELLNLSHANKGIENFSIIDVRKSLEKVLYVFRNQYGEDRLLFKTKIEDSIYVMGNESGFERTLINMIKNAVEAMNGKGTIFIELEKLDSNVILKIIDSGPGISEKDLEHIFYPFYTTKDDGTGIGLSICKTIVESMQGTISISNHIKYGAEVLISLPESKHASYKS
ncbi:HAMP domain-containing histidine kinase [Paenalkalicoccus suaedae]|uniref:histidine kinase n=1 Tax=Paenalkalicoccus suaedae TaxID=2592382 RepID=A0A859FDD9_9BACI|nr:HAMP domain-containing sensor histidine kinase [Paenalkalicoccus suaedae]QKS70594.1 HAMP domain-containing histidine kinase [Paenalkalicoccus suaedae]